MKSTYLFLFLTICMLSLKAQKKTIICGNIKSSQNFMVRIYEPLNGYSNVPYLLDPFAKNSALVNGKDSIFKTILIDRPSVIGILFLKEDKSFINRSDILLFPGDSVNIQFDLAIDNPNWATYSGVNSAGNKLFNEINYQPYVKYMPVIDILEKLPANKSSFTEDMDDSLSKNVERFKNLRDLKQISPAFFESMRLNFQTFYYQQVIDAFIGNSSKKNVLTKTERDSILTVLVSKMPPIDKNVNGLLNSLFMSNAYQNYLIYKKNNLSSINQLQTNDKDFIKNGKKYQIDKFLVPLIYIEDKQMQEDLWAMNLMQNLEIYPGKFDETTINQFSEIFPNSIWEESIRKQFSKYPGVKKIEYKLQSPIHYIDPIIKVNSLSDLLKELPAGKPVFIDCWATWCGPCIAAFTFNKELDAYLLDKKIEKLYISFDDEEDKPKWKKFIEKYSLGGYHQLANKNLINDIKKICDIPNPEKSTMGIPRYLLIDKKGIVALNNAASPHDFEVLKKQIQERILINL